MLNTILTYIASFFSSAFSVLFFWLPNDFLMPYINSIDLSSSPIVKGLQWLNWFAPIDLIITILAIITPIVMVWLGIKLAKITIQFIHDAINIFTP